MYLNKKITHLNKLAAGPLGKTLLQWGKFIQIILWAVSSFDHQITSSSTILPKH